mgnify:CR=1 FL=1
MSHKQSYSKNNNKHLTGDFDNNDSDSNEAGEKTIFVKASFSIMNNSH